MFESLQGEKRIMPKKACIRREKLTENGKKIYDAICCAVSRRETQVTVSGVYSEDVSSIVHAIFFEQPFFYYLSKQGMMVSKNAFGMTIRWQFRLSNEEIDYYDRQIVRRLKSLRLPKGGSALKREIYLHDIMQKINIRAGESDWTDHTIIGPLLLGHTVCEGMALLFCLLCTMCNIPCMCVIGSGAPRGTDEHHAWNIVRINGEYAHVDVFWDALLQVKEFNGYCYDYFNLCDRNMRRDHGWDSAEYPECRNEKHSYFAFQKADIRSPEEYRDLVRRCHDKGKRTVTARMHYTYLPDRCMEVIWSVYRDTPCVSASRRTNAGQRVFEVRINKRK